MVALVLGGLWWVTSPDPVAELRSLADPRTYTGLVDRATEVIDQVNPGASPHPLPESSLVSTTGAPPPGQGEHADRLLTAVEVDEPSSAYGIATVQDDGVTPVAWSPCRPIHVVVNTEGAPEGFADVVRGVVGELSGATGLAFVDDGVTSEAPSSSRPAYLPDLYGERWAPVLVAVTDPGTIPVLDGDVAGISYTYRARGGASGLWHLTSGAVYLDSAALTFPAASTGEPGWTAVLRHELGHLAGLDHVDDPSQLMNPVTSDVRTFQAGDLTGLALLGRGACAPDV